MGSLWHQLQIEWEAVTETPLLSFFVWIVGLIVIWLLVDKYYRSRIETRDDLLRMYQQKLGLGPHSKKTYSRLKNSELKEKVLNLAQNIRAFTAMAGSQISADPDNFAKFWPYVGGQYANSYKVESVLLRDEIVSRLSQGAREAYQKSDPKGAMAFVYQNPVNTGGMEMVADDLDKLARMLIS